MELNIYNTLRSGAANRSTLLPISDLFTTPRHAFLEHDLLSFEFISNQFYERVSLIVGDIEILGFLDSEHSPYVYRWLPKQNDFGFNTLFHNYFGIVELSLSLTNNSDESPTVILFEPIEVLARKITAERCEKMLEFLLLDETQDALSSLSPMRYGSNLAETGLTPNELLSILEQTVSNTQIILTSLIRKPITRVFLSHGIIDTPDRSFIDDQSSAWMIENVGQSEITDDPSIADFQVDRNYFRFSEIHASLPKPSTDIYENRFIHAFIARLVSYIDTFNHHLKVHPTYKSSFQIPNGYVSLFDLVNRNTNRTLLAIRVRLTAIESAIKDIRLVLNRYIPVTTINTSSFSVTEKMRGNKPYIEMMKVVRNWAADKKVQWHRLNPLVNINNAPKLFELYSVLSINRYLHQLSGTRSNELFNGSIDGSIVSITYEQTYFMPRGTKDDAFAINSDLEKRKDSLRNRPGKLWNREFDIRRPDITLSITRSGQTVLWILDAKYKSAIDAYERDLPSCTMKYFHGIHSPSGNQIVKGLFVLHPREALSPDPHYLDYHAYPYHLFGLTPTFPALGVFSVELSDTGPEQNLSKLIDRILSI